MSQQRSITLKLTCVGSVTGAVRSLFCGTGHDPVFAPGWLSGKMDQQAKLSMSEQQKVTNEFL